MPDIDDPRPGDVVAQITALEAALDQVVPAKSYGNLLVGTWNVRGFDRVRPVWRSRKGESPIRDLSNVACIAEIVRRFDVVAVQEVRRSAAAFLAMMQALGNRWAYMVTDVTAGDPGNDGRIAFVYDMTRVRPSGPASELVMAAERAGIADGAMARQFARTPYAVSFERGPRRFTLVTLHVLYGKKPADHTHFYDQIAWFPEGRTPMTIPFVNAGMFDFTDGLVPADTPQQLSARISDHFPLWCEFSA